MYSEKQRYCSPLLDQQVNAITLEITKGLYGYYQKPIESLENKNAVAFSLHNFAVRVNNASESYFADFLKEGQEMPRGKLYLRPVVGHSIDESVRWVRTRFSEMFIDGCYGFILCLRPKGDKPLFLAATSFLLANHSTDYSPWLRFHYNDLPTPVVVQLQAQHDTTNFTKTEPERKKLADDTLSRFRWEHALLALDVQWARSVGLPAIHVLPGSQNHYFNYFKGKGREKSVKIRYDISARRCGFKQDDEGLYTLELPRVIP
ncbi:MAG: hypothetical protein Q7K55_07920 [Candidatus Levybacteria bacterium]|nr:hypothetical protein [Candidatus Levybacteria bacterium]